MSSRRTYSPQFKAQVALAALRGETSQAALCRQHNLSGDLVCRWRQQVETRASELFATPQQHQAEQERIAQLEQLVGQLTWELTALKKTSNWLTSRSSGNGRS
jgi:transposase-like protein